MILKELIQKFLLKKSLKEWPRNYENIEKCLRR